MRLIDTDISINDLHRTLSEKVTVLAFNSRKCCDFIYPRFGLFYSDNVYNIDIFTYRIKTSTNSLNAYSFILLVQININFV